jgi:hypothetical protein
MFPSAVKEGSNSSGSSTDPNSSSSAPMPRRANSCRDVLSNHPTPAAVRQREVRGFPCAVDLNTRE